MVTLSAHITEAGLAPTDQTQQKAVREESVPTGCLLGMPKKFPSN